MTRTGKWRFVLLLFLSIHLSGCTGYRPASMPMDGSDSPAGEEAAAPKEGSVVRLVLTSGETVTGRVARLSEAEIVLGKRGDSGVEERVIPAAEIESLEIRHGRKTDTVMLIAFVVLVGGYIAIDAALSNMTLLGP